MDMEIRGLSEETVRRISELKEEPEWMEEFRLRSFRIFQKKPLPSWGPKLDIDFQSIIYYKKGRRYRSWDEVPEEIKDTFEKLGIPESEREYLAGVSAQWDSEPLFKSVMDELEEKGVIFTDMDTAVKEYPELVRPHFGKIVPPADNKFAALNSAVWSGGSFLYVPKGVKVKIPLQAYFRINIQSLGQFERTLIIAEKGSEAHYIEGCSAPIYSEDNLHAAVVEVFVKESAKIRYTTIQNWSKNVLNLVTKRAFVYRNARMEWVDGNIGSKVNMKYPSCVLLEEGASGEMLSIAYSTEGQILDAGAKMIHLAPNTSSRIVSKSIVNGGRVDYRGLVRFSKSAKNSRSAVNCDTLILKDSGKSASYPWIISESPDAEIVHEATTGRISEDLLFYLQSRGLDEQESLNLVVQGFVSDIVREIPLEYAVELNRLIKLEMEGAIG